jgi:hypothetical protein
VGVSNVGIVVMPGVGIGMFGTHKSSPLNMVEPVLQLATCRRLTVV